MFSPDDEDDDVSVWDVVFAAVGFLAGFIVAEMWFESWVWRMVIIGVITAAVAAAANRLRTAWHRRRGTGSEAS